ncbi:MAG: DUF3180 domain-containing protein [Nocardioidaceae bacterium]
MADQQKPDQGTIRPTRLRVLAVLFIVGALLGYGFVSLTEHLNGTAPGVEWTSVGALVAIGLVLLVLAQSTYRALHREGRQIDPQRAVNYLLLAKASSLVGSVMAGGYLGFGLRFVDQLDFGLPRERAIRAGCAALGSIVILVAGLLLERACRIPRVKDDSKNGPGG